MSQRSRRNHSAAFKGKVALAALRGEKALAERTQLHYVHATQIAVWKAQLVAGAAGGVRLGFCGHGQRAGYECQDPCAQRSGS